MAQTGTASGGTPIGTSTGRGARIDVDVVIIGAGFSGISTLYRTRQLGLTAVILEAGSDFGGVWYHNRYPGARVDSEWPFYQLNIPEVYTSWQFTERFPDHTELRRYMAHLDATLSLRKDTVFHARVDDCTWDAARARWTVQTTQQQDGGAGGPGPIATGKYLVLGTGLLHRCHYPDFPGLTRFKGEIHHSGFWPEELSMRGRRVALIGAGATAVQITQEAAKTAAQLTVFMRRPSFCMPMHQRPLAVQESRGFSIYYDALFRAGRRSINGFPFKVATKSLATDPRAQQTLEENWQRGGFQALTSYTDVVLSKESNRVAYDFWARKTRARMRPGKKRDLMAPLPEHQPYYIGTKRMPLEHDYYEMLDRDNVDVVNMNEKKIRTFTERGLVYGDGDKLEFDILILATGFDSFSGSLTNMGLKNKDGVDMKDLWRDNGITSYLGMTFAGFPNAFMVYSPHAPTAISNGTTIIEAQADMITSFIADLEANGARSVTPRADAEAEWVAQVDAMASKTLFPLTNSWWTGANIPGKRVQMLTYIGGIQVYEAQCRAAMEARRGFDVEYERLKAKV